MHLLQESLAIAKPNVIEAPVTCEPTVSKQRFDQGRRATQADTATDDQILLDTYPAHFDAVNAAPSSSGRE
ncbi:MAG: hypothetical protein CMQ15_00960 [Gammaproteobacteria bacterium]|nr:hypothetical protein [Gammaproteobacteria bacterium]